jgi:hypothetical protein
MDLSIFTGSLTGLTDIQKKAFQDSLQASLRKADADHNNVLDKKELTEGSIAFQKTDAFTGLSKSNQDLIKEKLNPDAIWAQQGAVNFDGNKLQTEYYEKLLNDSARNGKDGNPLVTQERLKYAQEHGFGHDAKGKGLPVADVNGDKNIDVKDGYISKDGIVNKDDKGINLGSSETSNSNSSNGFDAKKFAEFFQKLIEIWAPKRR